MPLDQGVDYVPRLLLLPSEDEVPPGPRRRFMEELYLYFLDAGRPEIPRIVEVAEKLAFDPRSGQIKLSRETVRKILKGKTLSTWARVESLLLVLCHISGRDCDLDRWAEIQEAPVQSHRDHLRELWIEAADVVQVSSTIPPLPVQKKNQTDTGGWGTNNGGEADGLPF